VTAPAYRREADLDQIVEMRRLERASNELSRFFNEVDGDIARSVRSVQSQWEAEMESRSMLGRHRGFVVRFDRQGIEPRVQHLDGTDLHCGCTAHGGQGSDGAAPEREWIDRGSLVAVRSKERTVVVLQDTDSAARAPDARWTCSVPPSEVLQLRFREVLPKCREPFGIIEGPLRVAKALDIQRQVPVRGAGNVAHLTAAAAVAWRRSLGGRGARGSVAGWTDRFGAKLKEGRVSQEDRALCSSIAHESQQLVIAALTLYRRAAVSVPAEVKRAARARTR
jgi:hypothetical protein